jgi:NodT family efflux transporter outer membrane factor (OMF) lipoprotein
MVLSVNKRLFICSGLALALVACTHIKGYDADDILTVDQADLLERVVPDQWQTQTEAAFANAIHWRDLRDPILLGLIETALQNNLTLESAYLSLESAEISLEQAQTRLRPIFDLGSGNVGLSQGRRGGLNETYSFGGSASYQVDLWGRIRNSVSRAELNLLGQETTLRSIRISQSQAVARTYIDIRVQDELIRLQEEQIRIQREQLRLSQARLQAGAITRLRVDQINVDIQRLLSSLESQKARRLNLERALALLLGLPPQDFALIPEPFVFTEIPRLMPDAPIDLLLRRPDIEQAEQRLLSSQLLLEDARNAWLPSVSLGARASQSAVTLGDFLTVDGIAASISAGLSILLYDNGDRQRQTSQSVIAQEQAILSYERALLSALNDIEAVLVRQSENLRQIEIQSLQQEAQERVTRITQAEYDTGAADAFDLIREQRNALITRQTRVQNWATGMNTALSALGALGIDPIENQ